MTYKLIPPCGPAGAKIYLVGEAPGYQETVQGIPFVGEAGELLNQLLAGAGTDRDYCRLDNVIPERPPSNDVSVFIKFLRNKVETSPEFEKYRLKLLDRVRQSNANVVVACGRVAMYALCGERLIYTWRGSVLWSNELNKKIIPTIHPAGALPNRDYLARYLIINDLEKAVRHSKFPELGRMKRDIKIRPSFDEAMGYLDACAKADTVAFDIETYNSQVSCIAFALSPRDIMSIPFAKPYMPYFTFDHEKEIWLKIAGILSNRNITKIGQNIIFDAGFLYRTLGIVTRNMEDTMIAQKILYADFPMGLDFITSIYTDEPYYKDEGKKHFKSLARAPIDLDGFWRYNAKDAAVTFEAFPKIVKELEKNGNYDAYTRQRDLISATMFMQEYGILVDHDKVAEIRVEVDAELEQLSKELYDICGLELNPKSPKQVSEYFYGALGHKPFTKKGKITVDVKALTRLKIEGYKEADILLQMSSLRDMRSRYLNINYDNDRRLRGAWNLAGTVSSRFSSSKSVFGTGTSMQNQPLRMKVLMVPDDGMVFGYVDLKLAENVVVAYIAPEPNMIQAIERNEDLHRLTAGLMFGKDPADISDKDGSCSIGGGKFSERFWGKKANHGLNYGETAIGFGLVNEIPLREAKYIVNRYFEIYPGVTNYHLWVQEQLRHDRTLVNCLGRKRHFLGLWSKDLCKEAYSYIPQSTISEINKQWGLRFMYEGQDLFGDVRILLEEHDSISFEIPISLGFKHISEIFNSIAKSLSQVLHWRGTEFSIGVEAKIGFSLGKMVKIESLTPESVEEAFVTAKHGRR